MARQCGQIFTSGPSLITTKKQAQREVIQEWIFDAWCPNQVRLGVTPTPAQECWSLVPLA